MSLDRVSNILKHSGFEVKGQSSTSTHEVIFMIHPDNVEITLTCSKSDPTTIITKLVDKNDFVQNSR